MRELPCFYYYISMSTLINGDIEKKSTNGDCMSESIL